MKRKEDATNGRSKKMSLEDYVDFFVSRNSLGFTIKFLNQILHMHGFLNIKLPKNDLANAVDTLDLVEPWRSTLKHNVSLSVATSTPTLKDVIDDLECLKWQECRVTLLEILNAEKEAAQIAPVVSERKHNSSKRKKDSIKRPLNLDTGDDESPGKTGNKKKKKKKTNRKKSRVAVKRRDGRGDGGSGNVEAAVPSSSLEVSCIEIAE